MIHIVRKSAPRFTSLVLIGLVLTEIQAFKNLKKFTKKCMEIRRNPDKCPDFHTFLRKFFTFLNACISVKTSLINTKLGDLWISVSSIWLCGSIVANPISYRLVPSPSRYEIRQCHAVNSLINSLIPLASFSNNTLLKNLFKSYYLVLLASCIHGYQTVSEWTNKASNSLPVSSKCYTQTNALGHQGQ